MKPTTAWTFYDWANSAFALVVTAAVFPSYFLKSTDSIIHIGDLTMSNSSLYAYTLAFAYFIVACFSPFASGFADSANNKKVMLSIFTGIGAVSCMFLYLFDGMDHLAIGLTAFTVAFIGFISSNVYYNSFLPEITTEDKFDSLSARGFSMGYIGSVILLIINLVMINKPEWFGIDSMQKSIRISFVMVGLWWILFAIIPLRYLPGTFKLQLNRQKISEGLSILKDVWGKLKKLKPIRRYLLAFFCYNAGVQTVMLLAAAFAEKMLGFETSELIILILILQILAIGGAYLFSRLSNFKSNKFSILTMLCIWVAICIIGYLVQTKMQFYGLAAIVGLVMGGIQSLSRSTYSKLIYTYKGETNSFFSFYDVVEKMSVIIGTFSFGFIEQLTGGMRNSIFALGIFFVLGIIFMLRTTLNFGTQSEAILDA